MTIVLAPDLGKRPYNEIADQVSMPARHLFWLLVAEATEGDSIRLDSCGKLYFAFGPIGKERLRAVIKQAGHDWTPAQVQALLKELAAARCLSVRE